MKRFFISLIFCAASLLSIAQTTYVGWFNNLQESVNNNFSFDEYNTTLFPEPFVQVLYGDGNGGTILGYVSTHGLGEVFDPKSAMYDNAIKSYNPYIVDSVGLVYLYNYVYEAGAAPDTLIFQFYTYNTSGVIKNVLTTNEICAYTKYDYLKNLGRGAISQYKYILGSKDAQSTVNNVISVPTNGSSGIKLKPNDLFAFTVSYRPGFEYQSGDIIDEKYSPSPSNLHSHFRVLIGNTPTKTSNADYENSLTITTGERNNTSSWKGFYIPGSAWNNYNQILWSIFHIQVRPILIDAGLNGFISPEPLVFNNHYCENSSILVSVALTNNLGNSDLTSATLSWTINGKPQKDYLWTGLIQRNNSATVSLGGFSFPAGNNTIQAWVSNPNGVNDSIPINDTSRLSFYVNPLPNAHFSTSTIASSLILFTPDDLSLSYNWDFGDGSSGSSAQKPSHLYAHDGNYTVDLSTTNQHTCNSDYNMIINITGAAVSNHATENAEINEYPNPFNDIIIVDYAIKKESRINLELVNGTGETICLFYDENHVPGKYKYELNAEKYNLKPGIYLLKLSIGNEYVSRRIVKN